MHIKQMVFSIKYGKINRFDRFIWRHKTIEPANDLEWNWRTIFKKFNIMDCTNTIPSLWIETTKVIILRLFSIEFAIVRINFFEIDKIHFIIYWLYSTLLSGETPQWEVPINWDRLFIERDKKCGCQIKSTKR